MTTPALPDPAAALSGPRSVAPGPAIGHILTSTWPARRGGARPALCGRSARHWRCETSFAAVIDPCDACTDRLAGPARAPVRIGQHATPSRGRTGTLPVQGSGPQTQAERVAARSAYRQAWALSAEALAYERGQLADLVARGQPVPA